MKTFRRIARVDAVVSICKQTRSSYGAHTTKEGRIIHLFLDPRRFGTIDPSTSEIRFVDMRVEVWWKLKNGAPLTVDYDPRTLRLIAWAIPTA